MKIFDQIYINGQFTNPHGKEVMDLIKPATGKVRAQVLLGDEKDVHKAVRAAKAAYPLVSLSSVEQRMQWLLQLSESLAERKNDLIEAMLEEYGASRSFVEAAVQMAINNPMEIRKVLSSYEFVKQINCTHVAMESVGVVGLITPWNSNAGFITGKFSTALAAGCTAVIKPSELSATQTQIVLEAVHKAKLPAGAFNLVNGRGDVVGAEITRHKDIAKISFTGSTLVGKLIAREATTTLKRVTLELGGKSPNLIFEDADLNTAIPLAIRYAYMNNGQACIAGTRLLVPRSRYDEAKKILKATVTQLKVGDPSKDAEVAVGPLVNLKQYEKVQNYIRMGLEEGAELLVGGLGLPEGLNEGYFVKPTVFVNVKNTMTIAREEIFGPVLSVIVYDSLEEAIEIANDTEYGLQSYISTKNIDEARKIARRLQTGRVFINAATHDPQAPFGGFKQSGIGREFGVFGLETFLEVKSILE